MENPINITTLNDFIFCPVSIYFHNLYEEIDNRLYQSPVQLDGTNAHKTIDTNTYSGPATKQGLKVYCEKYNLIGKIDLYNIKTKTLIERKKKIKTIYDGYIFQLYGQYFSMIEMGYEIDYLQLHSIDDNKSYPVQLPSNNKSMLYKFEELISRINSFAPDDFIQSNIEKCSNCIYSPYCSKEAK